MMEQWEKIIKKRLVSSLFLSALGMMNYVITSFFLLLSLQAGAPAIVFVFILTYIVILLAATYKMYKLINALRIDMNRGTTEAEYCELVSFTKNRLVVKEKENEKALYLPKALRDNKNLVPGKKVHVTYLQRSKTLIQIK